MNIRGKFDFSPKEKSILKFVIILVIIGMYWEYVSFHYGAKDGALITLLSWSFFVFCTPVPDAGFLVDFPVRVLTKVKMLYSETIVWTFAFCVNVFVYMNYASIYSKTVILKLFKHIFSKPVPYWTLIILSAMGTFLSVRLGDQVWSVLRSDKKISELEHGRKYHFILFLFVIILIIALYDFLIYEIGISVPFL